MNYKILVSPQDRHVLSTMRLPQIKGAIFLEVQGGEVIVDGKTFIEFFTDSQVLFGAWHKALTVANCEFKVGK